MRNALGEERSQLVKGLDCREVPGRRVRAETAEAVVYYDDQQHENDRKCNSSIETP
jgi:hypothetical protein